MSELEEIAHAYDEAETYLNSAIEKIRENEDNFTNKKAIDYVLNNTYLMLKIASTIGRFFREMDGSENAVLPVMLPVEQVADFCKDYVGKK